MTKTTRFVGPVSLLILGCVAADALQPAGSETLYDQAMTEFRSGNYRQALADLENIDNLTAVAEVKAELFNLRGVILMRQCEYEGAEIVLRRGLDLNPRLWNADFNLAEIPFLKKDWPSAQHRFEAMLARDDSGMDAEMRQLIRYKVLLTLVLQGKDQAVETMLSQLDSNASGPTSYYVRSAMAWRDNQRDDASRWQRKAEQEFSPATNKLYAESFYEVGWGQRPTGAEREDIDIVSSNERSARAQVTLAQAESAFVAHQTELALALLDEVDTRFSGLAASHNLRGEILLEECKFDEAEKAFREALADDPNLHEAAYNLAEVAFRKKEYAEARDRLERLFAATPGGDNQAAQLMKFKVFLTFLLEGRDAHAWQLKNQFKFTGTTPALYYAEAAWAFQHADPVRGNDWIESAQKIYSPELNIVFASSFYDLGWLNKSEGNKRFPDPPATDATMAPPNFSPEISISLTNWQHPLLSMNKGISAPLNDSVPLPETRYSPDSPNNQFLPEIAPP
ncbi:MAG TPA: tetratricopeptide repeat protein [Chthoniobacterales bacterium]